MLALLEGLRKHPYLKDRLALKGGTALNLFLFDLPRLSIDIDVNYIGSADRDVMLEERPTVDRAYTRYAVVKDCRCKRYLMTMPAVSGSYGTRARWGRGAT